METCFMSREKLFVKNATRKKGVNHCYCVGNSVRDEASKQHYFDTFEHQCRGIPLINVDKWILSFFSRHCSLSFNSGFPRRGQT